MNPPQSPAARLPSLPARARILVIRLRSIGDVVLLTPALHLLKEWRPDLRISVALRARLAGLLASNPEVEEVIAVGEAAGWRTLGSRLRQLQQLRRREFSLCVNLHGGPTSALLALASGAPCKVGFAHFRWPWLYHILVPDARTILGQPVIHTAEHQASAFMWLGLPRRSIPAARLTVSPVGQAEWKEKQALLGLAEEQPYAVVHPVAVYHTKQWRPENFARIGLYLEREAGLAPLFCCGPGESSGLDAVERAAYDLDRRARILRLEGMSLEGVAAALAGAQLFVGNDSGPAHMAVALGRPSVVIFGSSSSAIWGPWPPSGSGRIVQNQFECNPCPGDHCYRFKQPECILSVAYEQVQIAVEQALGQSGRATP